MKQDYHIMRSFDVMERMNKYTKTSSTDIV